MTTEGGGSEEAARLAEEFTARLRRGERPTIEEYERAHPELAVQIRELFTTLLFVEDLGADSGLPGVVSPPGVERAQAAGNQPTELQQVGEYRIIRELGRGGMGIVYEAEQVSLGRRVALKVLPFHNLIDAKRLERFQQEARAAARLSHPNIVPVYGVGEHLGLHYFVMQLILGQGLNQVIHEVRRQRREESSDGDGASDSSTSLAAGLESGSAAGRRGRYFNNIARLARDAALALEYAHGEGILHRDVKPSNLLLDPTGRVWLADFGLSKTTGSDDLTHSGDFVGTVHYMAPERFKGWSDPRSDVYSLGITLYELLTLQPAFTGDDRAEILRRVASEDPLPPRRLDGSIPRDLETIVLKAIVKEPSQRYGSARAMAEDLGRFLAGLPVEARRSNALQRTGRWCARNPMLAAMGSAVFLLLLTVAVVSSTYSVRLSRETTALLAEQAAGQEKLRANYLARANAIRSSGRQGRRFEALESLRLAAAIRPGPDLVNEALACLALMDVQPGKSWPCLRVHGFAVAPDGLTVVRGEPDGQLVHEETGGGKELGRFPPPGLKPQFTWIGFSRRGRFLAARQYDGKRSEWRAWDLERHELRVELKDGSNDNPVDFSPDDRWVVMGVKDGSLGLFDLATGSLFEEAGRGFHAARAAVHPGGRLIAFTCLRTRKVQIHDRASQRVIRSHGGDHGQSFMGVAWHPDGRTLAAANYDHMVYVWDAESGERLRLLQGHWAEVTDLKFNFHGDLLASQGWDPAVRLWDAGSDEPILSAFNHDVVTFGGDSRWFWTFALAHVQRWDLAHRLPAFTLFGHERMDARTGQASKHPHAIALARGGRLAATAGDDGVRLWDLAARSELCLLGKGPVHSVFFDPAGTALFTVGTAGLHRWPLRALDASAARIAVESGQALGGLEPCYRGALGGGGRIVAAIHTRNHAHLLDLLDPGREVILKGLPGNWSNCAVSADGAWAAAAGAQSGEVWLWDARNGEVKSKLPVRDAEVLFHPASTHLATSSSDEIALWELATGVPAWRLEREPSERRRGLIAFSEDGAYLAATINQARIWLLETASGRKLLELEAPKPIRLTGLALVGGRLAASTGERRSHVWDLTALAPEVAKLGLEWPLSVHGQALEGLPALRAAVLEETIDLLQGEECDLALAVRQLFRPLQSTAFLPVLVTFAHIDQALAAPRYLIPEQAAWKLFRGRVEPSPGMEWTSGSYNDRNWEVGKSPVTSWSQDTTEEKTFLADQVGAYTTCYLRHAFEVADPNAISRLALAVEIEDGFVAYLNGEEIGRANAGDAGETLTNQSMAKRTHRSRTTEALEIHPSLLKPGKNILALHVLTYGLDSRVHVLPVLAAVPAAEPGQDRERSVNLAATASGAPDASLSAYREGRLLQRAGQAAEALKHFERACELDAGSVEPWLRRLACLRSLGEPERAEALARAAIEAGKVLDASRLWRAWLEIGVKDLRRSTAELLAALPGDPRSPPPGGESTAQDMRWLLEELAASRPLRINCGGGDHDDKGGRHWSRDRFFAGGIVDREAPLPVPPAGEPDPDKALHLTERRFSVEEKLVRAYSIPLPPGRYRASLFFVEAVHKLPGRRVFDILLERRTVHEGYDPVLAGFTLFHRRQFEIHVDDGALDIDFLAHKDAPRITAIEVEAVGE